VLSLFNPVVGGIREFHQTSGLDKTQAYFKLGRASLGSHSEACRIFDAACGCSILLVAVVLRILCVETVSRWSDLHLEQ
jgi:hypothetical protein